MTFNIWLSNFARLAANEINQGQKGYQQILRERFLSACANNTDVSVRQFTLPSTIAETTPKIREDNQERSGQDNEQQNSGDENDTEKSGDSSHSNSTSDAESEKAGSDEDEDEDSEAEAYIRHRAFKKLQKEQKKSKKS